MGQRFGLKPGRSEKSLEPARNLTSITDSFIQSTNYQPHQLHYHSYPIAVSLILNICYSCKRLFAQQPLLIYEQINLEVI